MGQKIHTKSKKLLASLVMVEINRTKNAYQVKKMSGMWDSNSSSLNPTLARIVIPPTTHIIVQIGVCYNYFTTHQIAWWLLRLSDVTPILCTFCTSTRRRSSGRTTPGFVRFYSKPSGSTRFSPVWLRTYLLAGPDRPAPWFWFFLVGPAVRFGSNNYANRD